MQGRLTRFTQAAALAGGLLGGQAIAQPNTAPAAPRAQPPAVAPQQNFSDQQLQTFADASKKIAAISDKYTSKMYQATEPAAQAQVREQANGEMVEAAQDSGLSVAQFNQIGHAIQQDPALRQRVQKMAD